MTTSSVSGTAVPPQTLTKQERVNQACVEFFEAGNAAHAFVEMLAASDIMGEAADYRAPNILKINAELVQRAIDSAHNLFDELGMPVNLGTQP